MSFDPSQPFKVVEEPTGFDPSQPFKVVDDPVATREKEDRSKWGLSNVGGEFAQGALDQGAGSVAEGGLRIADNLVRSAKSQLASPELTQERMILEKLRADEKAVKERGLKVPNLPARIAAAEKRIADLTPSQQPALDQIAQAPGLRPTIDKTQEFRKAVREVYPVDSDVAASIPGQVVSGVGQAISAIPAYLTGLGLPASAGQLFDQGYQDAKQSGADDDTALESGILNLPAGVLEQIGDKFQIGGLVKALRQGNRGAATVAREALKAFIAEGLTEGTQQAYQNTVAKKLYAPDRKISEGVGSSTIVGGLTGATVATGTSSLGEGLASLDTGRNVPESAATLLEQQKQMVEGKRPAMMFPKGTEEIALPEGMKRVENERGVFHYDPRQTTGDEILSASRDGRENEVLGLGPVSKPEAEARATQTGEPLVAVTERTPAGVEVKSAVGTSGTAPEQLAALEKGKSQGNAVAVEPVAKTIVERMRSREQDLQAKARTEQAAEDARRAETKLATDAKKTRFNETLAAADKLAADPAATFPAINGALTSLNAFVEDNSLGLTQEQRDAALARVKRLQPRAADLKVAHDAASSARIETDRAAAKTAEDQKNARVRTERERMDAIETTGRDPSTREIVDITKIPDDELAALNPDNEGLSTQEITAELERRAREEERAAANNSGDMTYSLRDLFLGKKAALRDAGLRAPLRLLSPEAARAKGGPGGEHASMRERTGGFRFFSNDGLAEDGLAEQLRGLGFDAPDTASAYNLVERAFNGEDVRPSAAGELSRVDYAATAANAVADDYAPQNQGQTAARGSRYPTNHRSAPQARRGFEEAQAKDLPATKEQRRAVGARLDDIGERISRGAVERDRAARAINTFIDTDGKPDSRSWPFRWKKDGKGTERVTITRDEAFALQRAIRAFDAGDKFTFPDAALGDRVMTHFATENENAAARKPRALLTPEQVARQFDALRTALGPIAREFDLQLGLVADLLEAEGYTREARDLRAGKIGQVQAATAPRLAERITALRAQQRFIVISAEAAQQGKAPGLTLHELAHPFYDALPVETRDVLRQMHAEETGSKTGPLYENGELITDVAITDDRFPPARIKADPDLAVKEWFAERTRRLNEAWLEGRMPQGERPLLLRLWQQLLNRLRAIFAQVRGIESGGDLFTDTFRSWLESGLQANIGPNAAAYAARQNAQFASQSTFDLGGAAIGLELPAAIRNLSPRWQDKTLRFDSNLDKALYYAGGEGNTATRTATIEHLARETGLTTGQIATLARNLRQKLAPLARNTASDGTLRVPAQMQSEARRLTGVEFAAAARRGEPVTSDIKPETLAKTVQIVATPQTAFETTNRENRQRLVETVPEGGVSVKNTDQGIDIVLSRATLRHSFGAANGPAAYGTLAQARPLLESAVRIGDTVENLPPDGVKLHRYLAAANQRDGVVPVRITVSERNDGSFHAYDIQPIGHKKKLGPTAPSLNVRDGGQPQQAITVADLLPGVKSDEDGSYRADFATTDPERAARADALKAAPPKGVTTGDKLAQATLSDAAKDARHPAAVADPEPGEAWASAAKMSLEKLAAEQKKIAGHLSEYALDLSDIEKANLLARSDALKAEQARRADETIAAAPKVTALPKIDRKPALLAEWRRGKAMREEGFKTGDETAQDEGQRIVNQAKARLDEEFPGWEKAAYPAKPTATRETEDDGRNLPPPPPAEPPENGAPVPDEPAPDRGRARLAWGDSAVTPPWFEKSWAKIRDVLVGIRGSIPELPAFPALAAKSDRFIRDHGAQFYNNLRAFYRALNSANDFVQRTAEEQVAAITSPLLKIGGRFNATDYRMLKRRKEQLRRLLADGKPMPAGAAAELDALNSRLESHPYVLFSQLVYFMDLDWRARNLKDSEGNPIKLPYSLNQTEIDNELARLGRLIEASPHKAAIETAYEKHIALVSRIADDLKSRDLLAAEHLANPVYFPHLTLEDTRDGKIVQRELRPQRVRVGTDEDFRNYLIEPTGSTKPIESDYVRAMYYHLVQVGAHNFKADAIRDHVLPYNVRAEVEERAKELSKQRGESISWSQVFHEEYAPAGYVKMSHRKENPYQAVTIDRDKLALRLGEALTSADLHAQLRELGVRGVKLLPEDLTESLLMAGPEVWIVPARVAEALRGIEKRQARSDMAIEAVFKAVNSAWKRWKLFMPQNHVRYEYGNIVADLEKVFSASPRTFRYLGQSAKEMRAFFQGEAPSADLRAALKDGVINAITAQEINQLQRLRAFEKFQTAGERAALQLRKRASSALYQPVTNLIGLGDLSSVELSAFREGVTRYANYLANLDAIRNGARPDYAGAYWRDIEAINDSSPGAGDKMQRQAAQISKATFGDYGDLSVTGQYLRDKLIPFYSWMEVNFKYHANLLRNLRDQVRGEIDGGGTGAAAIAARVASARVGGFLLRLALPYAAVLLWNAMGPHGVEDDDLSEEDRRRFHIRLGKTEDGKSLVLYANTALADVMKWFSGARFAQSAAAWLGGRTDFPTALGSWAASIPGDFANNTIGSAGPTVKIPASIITHKNFFPDVLDARTIPDYDMRRNIVGQMTDDFTADMVERAVSKDYYASKDFGAWAAQLILQARQRDPENWAFYSIKDKAAAFEEKKTGRKEGATDFNAPDQQVLRNFRRAIYQGDVEAASRFYLRLLDLGYTAERFTASIRSQDPLSTLPKDLRRPFVESLDAMDRAQLDQAYRYYVRMAASRGRERALFPGRDWNPAAQERFIQHPRVNLLESVATRAETMPQEELTARAAAELRRSLQPR